MTVTPHDLAYFIILKITKHCGIETLTQWNIRNCWVNPQKPLQWNHPHSELGWVSLEEKNISSLNKAWKKFISIVSFMI